MASLSVTLPNNSTWIEVDPGSSAQMTVQNHSDARTAYWFVGTAAPAADATPASTAGVGELAPKGEFAFSFSPGEKAYFRAAAPVGANKTFRLAYGLA
jgi:hypothetical protein